MENNYTILKYHLKDELTMSEAKEQDTESLLTLLVETAKWFKRNGSTQWNGLLDGIDTHNTEAAIKRGDVFMCKEDERLAGMVMLLQKPSEWDCKLWGVNEGSADQSVYLHRLAVSRNDANSGLGAAILKWCKKDIQFKGKTKIRLDCVADNEFLNTFYKNAGFTYMGEQEGYALYQATL